MMERVKGSRYPVGNVNKRRRFGGSPKFNITKIYKQFSDPRPRLFAPINCGAQPANPAGQGIVSIAADRRRPACHDSFAVTVGYHDLTRQSFQGFPQVVVGEVGMRS
jgi:hypothetical protein